MSDKFHKRRRRTVVCTNCRRRKIACNRGAPCEQCAQARLQCTYYNSYASDNRRDSASSEHRPSFSAPSLLPVLGHGYGSEFASPDVDDRSNVFNPIPAPALSGTMSVDISASEWFVADVPSSASQASSMHADSAALTLFSPGQATSLMDTSPETGLPGLPAPPVSPELFSAESAKVLLSKSRMHRPTHWMTILAKYDQYGLFDDVVGVLLGGGAQPLIQKCKRLAREVKSIAADPRSLSRPLHDLIPPREVCDELVRLYLRTFEGVLRVLHIPSLQRDYLQYWSNPQAASESLVLQLLLVMAIGTCFYHDARATEDTLHFQAAHWVRVCHMRLVAPFRKKDLNLRGVQSQCLLVIALLTNTNAVGGDLVWTSTASLVQNAMTIGLHIAPSQLPVTPLDAEIRRRLWVTILELAVQSSLDSGNNPLISAAALSCEHPSNLNDSQLSDSTVTLPSGYPSTTFTQSSIQCALLRSMPVRLRIAEVLSQSQGELSYDVALRLGAELTADCRDTSELIDTFLSSVTTADNDHSRPSAFQIKLQDLLTRRFLLLLHVQFAPRAITDIAYHFSRTVCQECSLLLLSPSSSPSSSASSSSSQSTRHGKSRDTLWCSPSSPGDEDDYYADLQLFGDGLLKDVFLTASLVVCGEMLQQLREGSSPAAFSPPRRDLLRALDHGVRLTRRRVRAGETNAKAAAFFACMRAHISARRARQSWHAVADVAGTVLGECIAGLEARLNRLARNAPTTSERGGSSGRPQMHFPGTMGGIPASSVSHSSLAVSAAEQRLGDSSLSTDSSDTWNASCWDDGSGFSY